MALGTLEPLKTNDLFQTSAGVGHHWRPGYYFPSSRYKSNLYDPLPPQLAKPNEVTKEELYATTTGSAHDQKHFGLAYGNLDPLYKKAPASWKVDYNRDLHEKPGGFRRPLTMGYQTSETHEQFRAQPGISEPTITPNVRGYLLHGHDTSGPSQQVLPNTKNEKMRGRVYYPRDKAVMDLLDPYLTTNSAVHRRFTPKELDSYPRKDIATYWDCEEYPKSWGFGVKHNPVPKDSVIPEPPPMRDTMQFRSATHVPRVLHTDTHVPHRGLQSEYSHGYKQPSDINGTQAVYCPVDTPFVLPAPGSKSTFAAPRMYKSEYTNYGSEKPVTF